jgi:hypothetical protein
LLGPAGQCNVVIMENTAIYILLSPYYNNIFCSELAGPAGPRSSVSAGYLFSDRTRRSAVSITRHWRKNIRLGTCIHAAYSRAACPTHHRLTRRVHDAHCQALSIRADLADNENITTFSRRIYALIYIILYYIIHTIKRLPLNIRTLPVFRLWTLIAGAGVCLPTP